MLVTLSSLTHLTTLTVDINLIQFTPKRYLRILIFCSLMFYILIMLIYFLCYYLLLIVHKKL